LGLNPQGQPITVEEGETKAKVGGQDFIFSNNFKVSKKTIKDFNLPSNLEGLSMSDASKKISDIFKDRNDGISKNTIDQFLGRLADAQEQLKNEKVQKLQETLQNNSQFIDESISNQAPVEAQEFQEQSLPPAEMMQAPQSNLGSMALGQQQMATGGWFGTTNGAGAQANA